LKIELVGLLLPLDQLALDRLILREGRGRENHQRKQNSHVDTAAREAQRSLNRVRSSGLIPSGSKRYRL
jgi:hypothetical protein